jgi:hypothetical protein
MARKKKRGKKNRLIIAIELIILLILIWPMFWIGIFTGISYVAAIIGAVYSGIIFRKKGIVWYLLFGTILTYLAVMIMLFVWKDFESESWETITVMLIIAAAIWWKGFRMKIGKR